MTIDTEPDDAWSNHMNPSVANVQELVRLQQLLDRYGAKATCLVTYRVIQNDRAVDVLRRLVDESGAEIGAHLHPWENPPFLDSKLDVRYATYPHELPLDVFDAKLGCLTEAITRHFARPTAYRAGRWGLIAAHLPILERLAYETDTSVIPLEDWRSTPGIPMKYMGRGGIDYRAAPQRPYHPSYDDVAQEGGARILEVPVTVGFTRRLPSLLHTAYTRLPTILRRPLRKANLLRPVWGVPSEHSREDLLSMIANLMEQDTHLINLSLHSSELMLGGSPQSRTRFQVDKLFANIEAILAALETRGGCTFMTLAEAARQREEALQNAAIPAGA